MLGLLLAAQSGLGLALLPCQIGDAEAGLVRVIDPQPGLTGGFWILTHPELRRQPRIRAFFAFMAEEIVKYRPLLLGRTRAAPERDGRAQHAAGAGASRSIADGSSASAPARAPSRIRSTARPRAALQSEGKRSDVATDVPRRR